MSELTEEEFLRREASIEATYRDGQISLEQKRAQLEYLNKLWEGEFVDLTKHLMDVCFDAFALRNDTVVERLSDDEMKVRLLSDETEYSVKLLEADLDESEILKNGIKLKKADYHLPINKVEDHTEVLDVCLKALAEDDKTRRSISDLTTDGDGKDCEAIFDLKEHGYQLLKVR